MDKMSTLLHGIGVAKNDSSIRIKARLVGSNLNEKCGCWQLYYLLINRSSVCVCVCACVYVCA